MSMTIRTGRGRGSDLTGAVMLLLLVLFSIVPLVSMFLTALQPQNAPPQGFALPTELHWENFVIAFRTSNFIALFLSSSLIVVVVVPIAVILATLAGYGLSRRRVPGERYFVGVFLLGLTLPAEALITPLYYQMQSMGLLGTRWALILPLIALFMPFGVFWMRMSFMGAPGELSEAAQVDGATSWQVFWRVQLPLAVPAWASLCILFFIWTWNQFLLTIVLVKDPLQGTMAGALNAFQGQYSTNTQLLCAGSFLIMAPSLLIFFIFQKYFVKALLQGASK